MRFAVFIQALLFASAATYSLYQEKDCLFILQPLEVSRATYGLNPFPESVQIANYIKNNTTPNDKIAVLGSEPEILFYADRLSATGHIYMYGMMEDQPNAERMQIQMIREIEEAQPTYIVYVNVSFSWLIQQSSVTTLFNWGNCYITNFYDAVGFIDIGPSMTSYFWDNQVEASYRPVNKYYITVFKRKSSV